MTILQLKALAHSKRAAAKKILESVTSSAETRDMSPDETAKFDKLMSDVETIKGQVAQLESIEAAEDDPAEVPAPVEAGRSAVPAPSRRSAPIGEAPAVHTERRPYSILRAIRAAVNGQAPDGLEGEVNREMAIRTGRPAKGFFLPLGSDPEIRALMAGRKPETRADLTTTTGTGAVFTIAELPLIDMLRAKLVVRQLGATILTGLKGAIAIPRQTGSATVYWLAEGSSATASAPAIDQVGLSPKVAIALTNISRKFMLQSSLDAEEFVKNDLAETMAREWDRVCINGTGTTQPLGILQNSAIQTQSAALQGGTNGAALTYAQVVGMESLVAGFNADQGNLAYLTSPSQRGKLKAAPVIGSTYPVFLYGDGGPIGSGNPTVAGGATRMGMVNGYPAYVSSVVPANLTKGSASGTASAIIFANWKDLVIGSWDDVVDFLVNPYSNQANGAVTISMEMAMDVAERHNESFAIITDAL